MYGTAHILNLLKEMDIFKDCQAGPNIPGGRLDGVNTWDQGSKQYRELGQTPGTNGFSLLFAHGYFHTDSRAIARH